MKKYLFLLILLLIPFSVYAETCSPNDIEIESIELTNTTGSAEEIETSVVNKKINIDVRLKEVGDTAEYDIKIKNKSTEEYQLNNPNLPSNDYIDYQITYDDNTTTIKKKSTKEINIKVEYKEEVPQDLLEDNKFIDNNSFTWDITKEKIENPKTGNIFLFIIYVIIALDLIILFIFHKKKNLKALIVLITIIPFIPITVFAVCNMNLEVGTNIEIDKKIPVCKKATTLHTKTCQATSSTYSCSKAVGNGTTITYGHLVDGNLKTGDAFDCDVNNDGNYDSSTERFYYVINDGDNVVLIHNKNINNTMNYAYDSSRENWHGPRTAYQYLPSTSEWSNPGIVLPGERQITNTAGTTYNTYTSNTTYQIQKFTYTNKAARLLTFQEVVNACGNPSYFPSNNGEFDDCNYLFENMGYYETGSGEYGYWLETPSSSDNYQGNGINALSRSVGTFDASSTTMYGLRPVIEVKIEDLEH